MKSEYKDTLNALVDMQQSPVYAVRKSVLQEAEHIIVSLEQKLNAAYATIVEHNHTNIHLNEQLTELIKHTVPKVERYVVEWQDLSDVKPGQAFKERRDQDRFFIMADESLVATQYDQYGNYIGPTVWFEDKARSRRVMILKEHPPLNHTIVGDKYD
jgi:hypothetical protein